MTRAHFDVIASRYDARRSELFEAVLELLVREADLGGRRVLDLGCGTGRFSAGLRCGPVAGDARGCARAEP